MLVEFKFKNYRSFRGETVLSMEATDINHLEEQLLGAEKLQLVPTVGIYGKNSGGKSNVLSAFSHAVDFICNAIRTQHDRATIPQEPFLLDEISRNMPSFFGFVFIYEDILYEYGFSANKERVEHEFLNKTENLEEIKIFSRVNQEFSFGDGEKNEKQEMISTLVATNQLFLPVAASMNDAQTKHVMGWFRDHVSVLFDSMEFMSSLSKDLLKNEEILAVEKFVITADLGIKNVESKKSLVLPDGVAYRNEKGVIEQIGNFVPSEDTKIKTELFFHHTGRDKNGEITTFPLNLFSESKGTQRFISLAPSIQAILEVGGILLVDELERELHPLLVAHIISLFHHKTTNPKQAQLIFTTHSTDIMDMNLLRKDQVYFVEKSTLESVSELYSVLEEDSTDENQRISYLLGKYGGIPEIERDLS